MGEKSDPQDLALARRVAIRERASMSTCGSLLPRRHAVHQPVDCGSPASSAGRYGSDLLGFCICIRLDPHEVVALLRSFAKPGFDASGGRFISGGRGYLESDRAAQAGLDGAMHHRGSVTQSLPLS